MTIIKKSPLPNMIYRGKIRDTHDIGNGKLLMVATDRISAFDVVLPNAIKDKGAVLCRLSEFWFDQTKTIIPNHFIKMATNEGSVTDHPSVARQAMIVRRAERIDVECIVRGYITGSAWSEYCQSGTVSNQVMPSGLQEGDKFPDPLFTPTTKAEVGHDENMSFQDVINLVGVETSESLRETAINVYNFAHDLALSRGIIVADTKMEFGYIDNQLSLIDELLTPDSSRFWNANDYAPGKSQPNFDKQFVRDWLNDQGWNHSPPAPELPTDIVDKTRKRYLRALEMLTGKSL